MGVATFCLGCTLGLYHQSGTRRSPPLPDRCQVHPVSIVGTVGHGPSSGLQKEIEHQPTFSLYTFLCCRNFTPQIPPEPPQCVLRESRSSPRGRSGPTPKWKSLLRCEQNLESGTPSLRVHINLTSFVRSVSLKPYKNFSDLVVPIRGPIPSPGYVSKWS